MFSSPAQQYPWPLVIHPFFLYPSYRLPLRPWTSAETPKGKQEGSMQANGIKSQADGWSEMDLSAWLKSHLFIFLSIFGPVRPTFCFIHLIIYSLNVFHQKGEKQGLQSEVLTDEENFLSLQPESRKKIKSVDT